MSDFPEKVEAAILAGGPVGKLEVEAGEKPAGKGLVTISGIPMAALTLHAVRSSPRVERVVLVSPVDGRLDGPEWTGVDKTVRAGERMMDSFCNGVEAAIHQGQPMLICCGDLPLLTAEAVTDFITRCALRPEASIWYGFLRKEVSERTFPGVRHTWAKLKDGTFCGTGMMMLRPSVVKPVREAMDNLTRARKNMVKLAGCLGWGNLFRYVTGQLTVRHAELAGGRIFGVPCAGVEAGYAETGFNVDDNQDLRYAKERINKV